MASTSDSVSRVLLVLLVLAVAVLTYYFVDAHKMLIRQETELRRQDAEIAALSQRLNAANASIEKIESSNRELRKQLSVVRVALQQSTDVRIDSSGAVIKRKGSRREGIELR